MYAIKTTLSQNFPSHDIIVRINRKLRFYEMLAITKPYLT